MIMNVVKTTAVGVLVFVLGRIAYQIWLGGKVVADDVITDSRGGKWHWYVTREGADYVPSFSNPTGLIQKMGKYGKAEDAISAVDLAIAHAIEGQSLKAGNPTLKSRPATGVTFTASPAQTAATPHATPLGGEQPGPMPPMGWSALLLSGD